MLSTKPIIPVWGNPHDCDRDGHIQFGAGFGTDDRTTVWPGCCGFCGAEL